VDRVKQRLLTIEWTKVPSAALVHEILTKLRIETTIYSWSRSGPR
jgi:hypothetical protein